VKVWIDGQIVDGPEAVVPVTDHGFLYGDGVFEGLRSYGRRIFRLQDHLRRFECSARSIGLELPTDRSGLEKIVLETARANASDSSEDCYLRLIATRGVGSLGVDPTPCTTPRLLCIAAEMALFTPEKIQSGVDLVTVSVRRPALDALDPRVKSLNYLNSVLAKREAKLRGADEALILNAAGAVAEASVANVFTVWAGRLQTPPTTDGSLDGITRDSVFAIARSIGIAAGERTLSRIDLLRADEVFLTGTGARIVPVASLDGQPVGSPEVLPGGRPVTARVLAEFPGFAHSNGTPF
jgi:branched-chain amino acid aminotransferase